MNLRGFFAKVCSLNLFHKKDQNKVGLAISFIENAEIRYGWGFIPLNSRRYGVVVLSIITQ